MSSSKIFQENEEISRLAVQNRLLQAYEQPIYQRVISNRHHLKVLDIGCNNGSKTVDRFGCENITQVIGLEYHRALAEDARNVHGSRRFAFYQCDVEGPDFARRLELLMEENHVAAFDIIHISFVLMHLKRPGALLNLLHRFLADGGRLILVEADDSASEVSPDPDRLFPDFLEILRLDPFSGDRACGGKVPALLTENGYQHIAVENTVIQAGKEDLVTKRDIFDTFCSYLPQDIFLLRRQEPQNAEYAAWAAWLERHYEPLRRMILTQNTEISLGISIITCFGE